MTKAKPHPWTSGSLPKPVTKTKVIPKPVIEFTHDQLFESMLYAQEQLQRCQILFTVLGDAAHAIYFNHPMVGYKVVFGILERHAVPNLISVLKVLEPNLETMTDGWKFISTPAPVYCKIVTKNYHTLIDPDTRFFYYDVFRIPNPFLEYWECKNHYDI